MYFFSLCMKSRHNKINFILGLHFFSQSGFYYVTVKYD
jgi:hypothetical protein